MEILKRNWKKPIIATLILFIGFFVALSFFLIFSGGDPRPDDHYFHFKYAELLRTEGWDVVENFRWIYLHSGPDGVHHYSVSLFQFFLIPFTYFEDKFIGIHVADAFFASGLIAIIYYIMRREKVQHALFFTILFAGSTFFLNRFLLGRAFVLMVGFVYLEMHFAIRKKYTSLFFMVMIHILWHQATYFMPILVLCFVEISRYVVEKKVFLKNFFAVVLGTLTGMAFFPGFPGSLIKLLKQILIIKDSTTSNSMGTMGGSEMFTKSTASISAGHIIAGIVLFACFWAVVYVYYAYKNEDPRVKGIIKKEQIIWFVCLSFFVAFILVASFMVTGRFFDFAFPGFVFLAGCTFTILIKTNLIDAQAFEGKYFAIISCIPLFCVSAFSFFSVYDNASSYDVAPIKASADWINERSETSEKVFLHNWSYFVTLFFANSDNVYSMGLEPTTLKTYNEDLYWKYYNLFKSVYYCENRGDCKDELYDELMVKRTSSDERNMFKKENSKKIINSIKNDFDAKLIFSDSREFNGVLLLNAELIRDYKIFDVEKNEGTPIQFAVFQLK
ncbi:MAG: hypothetical protein CR972_00750 [Candidatus Moraniibacteriota bacterium]|nr:MAG: hypothetical protein CR972_00750 [Candidatus Moranbacteria bacterium]